MVFAGDNTPGRRRRSPGANAGPTLTQAQQQAALERALGIRGGVERLHRRLKDALKSRLAGPDWFQHLPLVLLGLLVFGVYQLGKKAGSRSVTASASHANVVAPQAEPAPENPESATPAE